LFKIERPTPKSDETCGRVNLKHRAKSFGYDLQELPLNRPGFIGECFVQMSGDIIKSVQVCIEGQLCFLWRDAALQNADTG
jgi:hypothetical protein